MNLHDDPTRSEETRILLQAAIESANDAIIITEYSLELPGPRIEYVNPAFTRMTQYTSSEIVGQTPRILQGPKTNRELVSKLREDLKTGQSFHGETTNYRKDGSEYEVEWRITPVNDRAGNPIKWVAVQRDVTDRVRAEAALKSSEEHLRAANQDLEQFVFAASHDLQEPIRNVTLHSQFLTRSFSANLPDAVTEHLTYILEGSRRLGNLIRDLLAYARASHNGEGEVAMPIDTNHIVSTVCDDLSHLVKESETSITAEELPTVMMNETHLQQIYLNLITNAIKYRKPNAAAHIVLGAKPDPENKEKVQLFVQDDGQGIPARYHKEIFGVFRRLGNQDSTGTGIGLAIVHRLVEKHGGSIWVESDGSSGSTFVFTVLRGVSANAKAKQHSAH